MRRATTVTTGMALLLLALYPAQAPAQMAPTVGVVTTLSGHASVARASLPQPLPLKFKDDVLVRDRISTAEKSIVRVLLGGKALVTVRELSVLTITEELGRSTVDLQSGKIAMGVARQRMRPGEVIEVHTPNAIAAVRGTVLVVEIIQASAQAAGGATPPTTNVHVLRGAVDVYPADNRNAPPTRISTLETFSRTGNAPGVVRNLSPEAAQQLFADLSSDPQFSQGPGELMDEVGSREQARAAALAFVLAPGEGGPPGGGAGTPDGTHPPSQPPVIPPLDQGGGGGGGGPAKTGRSMFSYSGQSVTFPTDMYSVPNKANVTLADPLLETTASTLTVGGSLLDIKGVLDSTGTAPFIYLDPTTLTTDQFMKLRSAGTFSLAGTALKDVGGTITVNDEALDVSGNSILKALGTSPVLDLDGTQLTMAKDVASISGAGSQVTLKGALLEESNGARVTANALASVGQALLDATAPLLRLLGGSIFTSAQDAVSLSSNATMTSLGSLLAITASTLTVQSGAALALGGGSIATVTGDLFTLSNRAALTLMNGPLLSLSGNSILTVTGALINFGGSGNTVSVTNSLCPCTVIGGIPFSLPRGFNLGNISITNPIKNAAGGTINYAPNAALISINGANTKLTVQGN